MKKLSLLLLATAAYCLQLVSAQSGLEIYPSNWWVGMKNKKLQLMIHQKNIGKASSVTVDYPGVYLIQSHPVESPNYLFLDLVIAPNSQPGKVKIGIVEHDTHYAISYELRQRQVGAPLQFATAPRCCCVCTT